MAQRVIPVAITAEYVGGDGVTLGAAGSHSSVVLEYDFRAAGPQWEGTTKYVLWTNPQGNSTNRVNLGVDKLVEGYGGKVYHDCPTADAMCVAGWAEMVVVGVTVNNSVETVKIKTEPSRFRVLPATGRASDNEGIAATVADQLQTEIEVVDSRKVNKPISPYDPDGEEGQVLVSLGEGATKWVDAEAPTEDVVERVLSQHPEWTTTVQDGALTSKKLKPGEIGGYRPEQFGAAGDGVTDDTAAIKNALEAAGEGGTVVLEAGARYLVKETLQMQDRQTLDGNGATLIWEGEPTLNSNDQIIGAPYIIEARGSTGTEVKILEAPRMIGGAITNGFGTARRDGFTEIKVGTDMGLHPGDRIVIQAARDALSEESGAYWCGTITAHTPTCHWAEVLVVNNVEHEDHTSVWTVRCSGSLTYPYYLPDPTEEDVSRVVSDALRADTGAVIGYYVKEDADYTHRAFSGIRKVNFLRDVTIRNLNVEAMGVTHTGEQTLNGVGDWRGRGEGNTIYLSLCEEAKIENVKIRAHDVGRGFWMQNCWRSTYKDSRWEAVYQLHAPGETTVYNNAFTFSSCWDSQADGCDTIRAGQSFDTTYVGNTALGEIRCPPLYIRVRNCTIKESMSTSITNHSGCWGETFEGCRFIGNGREMTIRSPMTTIRNCSFTASGGDSTTERGTAYKADPYHILFSEPTIWGCTVEGCTFDGGHGIRIAPYIIRYVNFIRENYLTAKMDGDAYVQRPGYAYDHVVVDETAAWPNPPEQWDLGIRIKDNVFHHCNCALYYARPYYWLHDKDGNLRDCAKKDVGVSFSGNTLIACGAHFFPIYLEHFSNGVEIVGNRFVRCSSETPSYKRPDGAGVTCAYLISYTESAVRMKITDNVATETGGAFRYLYPRYDAANENLGTHGVSLMTEGRNRADGISITPELVSERIVVNAAPKSETLFQGADSAYSANNTRMGLQYDFAENTLGIVAGGFQRAVVSDTAFAPARIWDGDCLLRSWCYINAGVQTKVKWRTALYAQPMYTSYWMRVLACWDAGKDEAGNTVSFASPIVLVERHEEKDPDTGETVITTTEITIPAPINAGMQIVSTGANDFGRAQGTSIDATKGWLTVNVPASSAPAERFSVRAFHVIPSGFAPAEGSLLYGFTEVRENNSGEGIRLNADGDNVPTMIKTRWGTNSSENTAAQNEIGHVYYKAFTVGARTLPDLGTEAAPWGNVHANTISVGSTQLSEAQLTALLDLLN